MLVTGIRCDRIEASESIGDIGVTYSPRHPTPAVEPGADQGPPGGSHSASLVSFNPSMLAEIPSTD